MMKSSQSFYFACLLILTGMTGIWRANASDPAPLSLRAEAQVEGQGVFLDQIATGTNLFRVRLTDAPAFGAAATLTRAQVRQLVGKHAPDLATTNWNGAESIKITRQARGLEEEELIAMLAETLKRDNPQNSGDLEIRFTRPWTTLKVPSEPVSLAVLSLPVAGISPTCIIRFELRCGSEVLGAWSVPVQAKLWREVWVAQSPLRRGELVQTANLVRERRDVLIVRDTFAATSLNDSSLELTENVAAGAPLLHRSVRMRPVVQRGKTVEAIMQDGALIITAKVQALEDGLPGQLIRVRNMKSGREFRGKVQNDQTIQVSL